MVGEESVYLRQGLIYSLAKYNFMKQKGENKMMRYMNGKTVVVLILAISAILAGAPGSFAYPRYLTSLHTVYGDGSCGTCHYKTSGGGPLNSYGMLFEKQPDYVANASAALMAIGPPSITTAAPSLNPVSTSTSTETQAAPGFGFVISLIGLFSWALLARISNSYRSH